MKIYAKNEPVIIDTQNLLRGVRAKVVAVSRITGTLTVELTEGAIRAPAYRCGDRVNLAPYEVRQAE